MGNKYAMTFTGQFEIWPEVKVRSFKNEVVWYGHDAYQTTRLDQASSLVPRTSLYHHHVVVYWRKRRWFMTSHDLRWTFPVPLSLSGTRIITDEIICHNTERIGWFWLVYTKQDAFQYFTIGFQCKGHESGGWPDLRSEIYKLWDIKIAPTCTLTKTWREEIDQSKTLALAWLQAFLRWASGDLTWPDPATFFVKMCAMNV